VVATEAQEARRERAPHSTMRHPTKEAQVAEKRRSRLSFPKRLLHENPICAWFRRLASAKPASNFESIFLPYLARLSSCAASLLYRRAPRRSHAEVSFVVTTSYEPRNHGARGSNLSSTRIFSSPRRPTCNPRNPQATRPPGMILEAGARESICACPRRFTISQDGVELRNGAFRTTVARLTPRAGRVLRRRASRRSPRRRCLRRVGIIMRRPQRRKGSGARVARLSTGKPGYPPPPTGNGCSRERLSTRRRGQPPKYAATTSR